MHSPACWEGKPSDSSAIDTSTYGQVDNEITLAPAGVLMLGAAISTATVTALSTSTHIYTKFLL
jgi:hypothetical protein